MKLNPIPLAVGLSLLIAAGTAGGVIAWSNPDMTNRRLWLEYPWWLALCCVVALAGMAMLKFGVQRPKE